MAPPNVTYTDNPIELMTAKAYRVMGMLIESWATGQDLLPAGARREADDRLIVFSVEAFRDLVAGLPEEDRLGEQDIAFRDGVTEIELLMRRPDRMAMVMPEEQALAHQHQMRKNGWPIEVKLPDIYREIDHDAPNWAELMMAEDVEGEKAPYQLRIDGADPLKTFLHPYMAGYCCAQCS